MKYETCTKAGSKTSWCYTEVDKNGVGVSGKWGYCNKDCERMYKIFQTVNIVFF